MAGILIGSARISLTPDSSGFMVKARDQVKAALADVSAAVPIKFEVDAASVLKARTQLGPLAAGKSVPIRFSIDRASAARAQAMLGPIAGKTVPIRYDVNTAGLTAADAAQKTLAASTKQTTTAAATMTPALIGAGVALGGVVTSAVAAGAGLAAFGLFAVPPILKVVTAIRGPGGLAASWATLTPLQQTMALGLQSLGQRFTVLSNAMAPQTLRTFGSALGLANSLLGPTAQLATSAGAGISSFLAQFQASSGIQSFISYLSRLAGPSIALLGGDITNIAHAIFALLQAAGGAGLIELKALSSVITGVTTSITWLSQHAPALTGVALAIGGTAVALSKLGAAAPALKLLGLSNLAGEMAAFGAATKGATLAEKGMLATTTILDSVSPVGWAVLAAAAVGGLAFAFSRAKDVGSAYVTTLAAQDKATGFNIAGYQKLAGQLGTTAAATGAVNNAIRQGSIVLTGGRAAWVTATTAQSNFVAAGQQASAQARNLVTNLGALQQRYGITRTQAEQMASAAGVSATKLAASGTAGQQAVGKIIAFGNANVTAQRPVIGLAAAVTQLTAAMTQNVTQVLTLQGDELGWQQSLQAANTQLASNRAGLRGNSAAAIANRQAVLASTNAAVTFATDQLKLHGNLRLASSELQQQIKWLEQHGQKSKFAAAEIRALRAEEALIQAQIRSRITVSANGSWTVTQAGISGPQPGKSYIPGGIGAARGMLVTGGVPNKDSVLVNAMPGELVVPTHLVAAGVVDHLRGQIPGFAQGGVVGSYAGAVPGLGKWLASEQKATVLAVQNATAAATAAGMKSAIAAATATAGAGAIGGGVRQWTPLVLQVLRMLGQPAADLPIVLSQMTTESGGRVNAINLTDANARAGIPSQGLMQVIPPTFAAYAGPYANLGITNPFANIYAGLNYAIHRYGSAWTSVLGHGHGYDSGGWLPQGLSLAANHTGAPELVLTASQLRQLGEGGGVTYQANFDGITRQSVVSEVRAAFTAMSMNDTRRHRLGRQQ